MELSKSLLENGKTYEALERLKQILSDFENTKEEWKIHEIIGAVFHDIGDSEGVVQAYFNAVKSDKYLRTQRTHYSNYLFALHYLEKINSKTLANEHFIYQKLYSEQKKIELDKINSKNKIIIGYIAQNFLESSSARFYEALLTEYSREEFIIKCFSISSESDRFTDKIKMYVKDFIILENLSIEESAQKISKEGIDILFDLSGHSEGGMTLQIMNCKPSKIQICGIGWFDTTGMKAIDYILTDNYLAPIGQEKYFVEKLIRMSGAFAFKPTIKMEKVITRIIDRGKIIFGSLNNFMKITDEYLKCVKKILKTVENSRFIVQDTTKIAARKVEMKKRLKNLKMPLEKIEIRLGNDDYLNDYEGIDIILDTFPYNGCAMTSTALYLGVPVVSLYGTRYSSRFGADILRLAGMSKLIAKNTKNYVEIATALANDTYLLQEIKKNLKDTIKASRLCDTKYFVKEIEYNYKQIILSKNNITMMH